MPISRFPALELRDPTDLRGNALAIEQINSSQSRNKLAERSVGLQERGNALAERGFGLQERRLGLQEQQFGADQDQAQQKQLAQESAAVTAAFLSAPPEQQQANYPKMRQLGQAFGVELPETLNDEALFIMRQAVNKVASSGDLQKQITPDTRSAERQAQELELRNAGRAPGTTVNVDTGTIPPGHRANRDENGRIISFEPVPGSPEARKIEGGEQAALVKKSQTEAKANIVVEDIGRLLKAVENSNVTGPFSLLAGVPGSSPKDAQALVDTIRANVGFDQLQKMREASPTGGALGQVSEQENRLLQSVLGSLELAQSKEQVVFNLKRLEETFKDVVDPLRHERAKSERKSIEIEGLSDDDLLTVDPEGVDPDAYEAELKKRGLI